MEGAGTVGLEIAAELPEIQRVYVPMGSGTLATGVATAIRALQQRAEIVAVQPEGSPAMVESYRKREPIQRAIETIADSLVCRVPARRALAGIIERVTAVRLVSDDQIMAALYGLMLWGHLLAEAGAAAGLAAAWNDRHEIRGRRVVVIVSGANASAAMLNHAINTQPFQN